MLLSDNTVLQHIETFYTDLNFSQSAVLLFSSFTIALGIFLISYLSNLFTKRYLIHFLQSRLEKNDTHWSTAIRHHKIVPRLSYLIPAIIIYTLVPWMIVDDREFTTSLEYVIQKSAAIYMVATLAWILADVCNIIEEYCFAVSTLKHRPIKSYIEVAKILIVIVTVILTGSIILDKSPVALLTGLGAITAILSLVFKDFILGFVASIQIGRHDLIRLDDYIEVPDYGAEGKVIDISLNTVKVQNLDNTIVILPTYALTSTKLKNWRGILDAGGRQIKRAINIDMHSIHFCDADFLEKLKKNHLINEFLMEKELPKGKIITNLGIFRNYLENFLQMHPDLHHNMASLVRQLAPSAEGLPLEIYVFSHHLTNREYESTQADLFDHILAILPHFELRVFQNATD